MSSKKRIKELKFKACDVSVPLPTNPEPNSVYIVKNGSEFEMFPVDSDGNYLNQAVNNIDVSEKLGYALLINLLHTENNPFIFEANTPFTFPLRNDFNVNSQSSAAIDNLIDSSTNEIVVSNINDMFIIRLEFKMKTTLAEWMQVMMDQRNCT